MSSNEGYEAIKLLAQAKYEHGKGRSTRALKLLGEIVSLAERSEALTREHVYLLAHIELHRIHLELGNSREAAEYYKKARKLGATSEQLRE